MHTYTFNNIANTHTHTHTNKLIYTCSHVPELCPVSMPIDPPVDVVESPPSIDMEPPSTEPEPASIDTWPPSPDDELPLVIDTCPPSSPEESPAVISRLPPIPVSPVPTFTEIAPPVPPAAFPLLKDKLPLFPALDVPDDMLTSPLTPLDPAFDVASVSEPESVPAHIDKRRFDYQYIQNCELLCHSSVITHQSSYAILTNTHTHARKHRYQYTNTIFYPIHNQIHARPFIDIHLYLYIHI